MRAAGAHELQGPAQPEADRTRLQNSQDRGRRGTGKLDVVETWVGNAMSLWGWNLMSRSLCPHLGRQDCIYCGFSLRPGYIYFGFIRL